MNVLIVDVGGTHVKVLATGQEERREFPSGPALTAEQMVHVVKELAGRWKYDTVSIGYPGMVLHGRPAAEPHNLAPGWVGFDYQASDRRPNLFARAELFSASHQPGCYRRDRPDNNGPGGIDDWQVGRTARDSPPRGERDGCL
jgi:hypothetical protein